jgi:hypothetical protein
MDEQTLSMHEAMLPTQDLAPISVTLGIDSVPSIKEHCSHNPEV